jgi:hypothetical protein
MLSRLDDYSPRPDLAASRSDQSLVSPVISQKLVPLSPACLANWAFREIEIGSSYVMI